MAKIDSYIQTMERTMRYLVVTFPIMIRNGLIEQDDADQQMINICEILQDLKKQKAATDQLPIFTPD